jgi:hypothetical protein
MQQKSDHKGAAQCGSFICLHFLLLLEQVVWRELKQVVWQKVAVFIVVLLEQRFWRRNSDVIDCFMMNTSNLMWSLYLSWLSWQASVFMHHVPFRIRVLAHCMASTGQVWWRSGHLVL